MSLPRILVHWKLLCNFGERRLEDLFTSSVYSETQASEIEARDVLQARSLCPATLNISQPLHVHSLGGVP
jgi:hypothetical protein